jgi:hypothetical protein
VADERFQRSFIDDGCSIRELTPFSVLAPVVLSSEQSTDKTKPHLAALALHVLPLPRGMTAFDLPDGRRVFALEGSDPDAVGRYVAERETTR